MERSEGERGHVWHFIHPLILLGLLPDAISRVSHVFNQSCLEDALASPRLDWEHVGDNTVSVSHESSFFVSSLILAFIKP